MIRVELLNAVMNISEHPNMSTLILFGSPLGAACLRSLDARPTHQMEVMVPENVIHAHFTGRTRRWAALGD